MNEMTAVPEVIAYPDSDGKPMADNTLQWEWMVRIVGELREQFKDQNVFVAGDLFWYPVQGSPRIVAAPDALVVFGRPPGYRGSYKQWEEENIAPQVVFEVLSPCNTDEEMTAKLGFYNRHGVDEYYFIDPYENVLEAHHRRGDQFVRILKPYGWVSPRLGIRFERKNDELVIYGPDGRLFQDREDRVRELAEELRKTSLAFEEEHTRAIEESQRADNAENRADEEAKRADEEAKRADEEAKRAEFARNRAEEQARRAERAEHRAEEVARRAEQDRQNKELLATKLRELGLNPDELLRSAG